MQYLVNSVGTNVLGTTGKGLNLTAGQHTIETAISGDVTDFAYMVDGVVHYEVLGVVADYIIDPTALQGSGVYSNFIFTTAVGGFIAGERTVLETAPQTFLYMVDDVVTSDVLVNTADIIGWLPTLEDGSTVIDMIPKTSDTVLGTESVVGGEFDDEPTFLASWNGIDTDWTFNGDGTVTHVGAGKIDQTVVYQGGRNKMNRLEIVWSTAASAEINVTVDGGSQPPTTMSPYIYDFDNENDDNKFFSFARASGDPVVFESVSIKEIVNSGGTAIVSYDIVNFTPSVRVDAEGDSSSMQAIAHKLDASGMIENRALNMSLTSNASRQTILEASYTATYLNSYLETVVIPTYSAIDMTHVLVTTTNYETVMVDPAYSHLYMEAGLYPNLITLSHSGTDIARKSMSLHNGDDIHPCYTDFATETARISIDFDGASYWDISRMSNAPEYADKPNFQVFGGSSYNVFDRIYMVEHGHAIRLHDTGTDYNTVQSGYFESMNMAAVVSDRVTLGIDSRNLDDITIRGTKFINNDIFDTNDCIQTILSSGSLNCSFPGTIMDGNRLHTRRFTNGTYGLTYEKIVTGWDEDMSFTQATRTIAWTQETLSGVTIGDTIHVEGSGIEGQVGVNDGEYTIESFTDKTIVIVEDALTDQPTGNLIWASVTNNIANQDKGKFFDSGEFMIGENAIDLKVGSNEPLEPMVITNNIMSGWKQTDVTHIGGYSRALGNAFVAHYKSNNVVLEDNIWFDCGIGIGISGKRSGDTYTIQNWSVKRNIFLRLGTGNPYKHDFDLINFTETDGVEYEENIHIDTIEEVGRNKQLLGYYTAQGITNTNRNNVFISSSGNPSAAYMADIDVGVNYYYAGVNLQDGDAAQRIEYPTAEEAILANLTYFTDVIKDPATRTDVAKTTASSPHYAVCNPTGVAVPLEGGAMTTPYSLRKVMDSGEVCIYTDDGTVQTESTDGVSRPSSPLVGDIYMAANPQFGDVQGEIALYEVYSGLLSHD